MTRRTSRITPTALLAVITLAAAPSFAQDRDHGREARQSNGQSNGQTRERPQPRSEAPRAQPPAAAPAPHAQAQPQRPQAAPAPRVETRQQQAPQVQQPVQAPRAQQPVQATRAQQPAAAPRADNRSFEARGNNNRGVEVGRAVPRANVYAPHSDPRYSPRVSSPRVYSPRGYGYYGTRSYYRPYVFRPRFSIGFGIFAGYPVPYTYSYPYPIEVYGYRAPSEAVMVTPGSANYGGVALEMTPYDADVFVDGQYAGHVEDFDGTTQPLTLSSGAHQIVVQAPGYEPMTVNVEIQPGQVIPYRGDLRQY